MDVLVKICGLSHPGDIESVAALAPDYMGFVFWPRSPRNIDPADAARWTQGLPESIRKVGVFVDTQARKVHDIREQVGLDIIQLHGKEPPSYVDIMPGTVWKALHLSHATVDQAIGYSVDAFVADSYSADAPGGTGLVCDWSLVRSFMSIQPTPVMLAGGLTAKNVREAIQETEPWGVDVSSGVEATPGRKNLAKVKAFIEQCRSS